MVATQKQEKKPSRKEEEDKTKAYVVRHAPRATLRLCVIGIVVLSVWRTILFRA